MTAGSVPRRVLVVDDDAMSSELLCVLLEADGYSATAADSGEAALALLSRAEETPDVVLADMQMPGTTGERLAGELRRACGPRTLLLAMSGSQPPQQAVARFDGFLLKPFKIEQIGAALAARTAPVRPAKRAGAPRTAVLHKREAVSELAADPAPNGKPVSMHTATPLAASNPAMNTQVLAVTSGDPAGSEQSFGVLNDKIYGQLAVAMPVKQLNEMYAMCINDVRDRIIRMRVFAAEHDNARFVREAHSIKGGCGMLGATELHSKAAELERSGITEDQGIGADPLEAHEVNSLDDLAAACDRLERILGSRV